MLVSFSDIAKRLGMSNRQFGKLQRQFYKKYNLCYTKINKVPHLEYDEFLRLLQEQKDNK